MLSEAYACPKCKRWDKVDKVSKLFAPPKEPPGLSALWYIAPVLAPATLFAPVKKTFVIPWVASIVSAFGMLIQVSAAFVIFFLTTMLLTLAWATMYYWNLYKEDTHLHKEKTAWSRAMRRWEELYHCAADEQIFYLAGGFSLPAEELDDILFSESPFTLAMCSQE